MTMFNNKLVVALKHNGKILREFKDQIRVPFGSEYSIYVKNLNSVRALVKIEIDGKDIGGGSRFVVQPNSEVEIERSLASGNLNEGNRFKFIERTGRIEEARGIGAEDGLVRVEFQFERVVPAFIHHQFLPRRRPYWDEYPYPKVWYNTSSPSDSLYGGDMMKGGSEPTSFNAGPTCDSAPVAKSLLRSRGASASAAASSETTVHTMGNIQVQNENGITVPGSVSDQRFTNVSSFATETETHVIVLRLVGAIESNKIVEAVTVKSKPKCVTCNHTNKVSAKFCSECGTSLTIV